MLDKISKLFARLYRAIIRPLVGGGGGPKEPLKAPPDDAKQ